ncbi:MAG: 50S ribosomal protein L9 [Bacteroidetes bacterium]|nr:50S ribosomal protein L9 [Bacteroidota bacterium]
MKVILRQNIDSLGKMGEVVSVKDGYARNYLLPRGAAYVATKGNERVLEQERKSLQVKINRERKSAEDIATELEKHENAVTIAMPVGEEDKLFGTVTKEMIAEKLSAIGFSIDKRKIEIDEPIKVLGIYTVTAKLHTDVSAKIKVWVVRQES